MLIHRPSLTRLTVARTRKHWTPEERMYVYKSCMGRCLICGDGLDFDNFHMCHYIPVSEDGSDDLTNIFAGCPSENESMGALDSFEYFVRRRQLSPWEAQEQSIAFEARIQQWRFYRGMAGRSSNP